MYRGGIYRCSWEVRGFKGLGTRARMEHDMEKNLDHEPFC